MPSLDEQLNRLLGLETHYADQAGHPQSAPPETVHALWDALGAPGLDGDAGRRLAALQREEADSILDPVIVLRADRPLTIAVRAPEGARKLRWEIVEETGARHHGDVVLNETERGRTQAIRLRGKPGLGYHRLVVRLAGRAEREASSTLIVVPARAYMPPALLSGRGGWGLAVQLYGLRSERNWGIGDFGDLRDLVELAAPAGAAAIGLNPLHALFPDEPGKSSPYSPSSRLFLNTLYLDPEAIDDFASCASARQMLAGPDARRSIAALRGEPLVDYAGVSHLKQSVFELLYESFRARHLPRPDDPRTKAFRRFQQQRGAPLRRFATFQTIREYLSAGSSEFRSWRRWPAELRDPHAKAVDSFAAANVASVEFHEYLQWQCDIQLGRAAAATRRALMGVGLYQDLAVGFDPDGADAWAGQDTLVDGWSIGAPPDDYNMNGQNWGLLPPNPRRLRHQAYQPIVDMLRANMRHAGALRIDHVLGLKRLFWVPNGARPAAGAYVHYPLDDLLGLVALESVRSRCLIVGEDLGTVPPGFREQLNARGIFSYEVLYFARDRKGGYLAPRRWTRDALAAVSTHDLPTLAGFWTGHDIGVKDKLSLYPDKAHVTAAREERKRSRAQMSAAFAAARLRVKGNAVPVDQAHRFLARTRSRLVMAQIEDLIGAVDAANLPGTVNEHPNWRRRLPRSLRDIFADTAVQKHLAVFREERPRAEARAGDRSGMPRATYRLQLNKHFAFADAEAVLPYLHDLGISHLYLSPIFQAQPGSTHGYDTVSYERISPELGGDAGFARLCAGMRRYGLRAIVDFVPNHMGIAGLDNAWWVDVLEWGAASPHAAVFDIDWAPATAPDLKGKVLVPVLGDSLDDVLTRGELRVEYDKPHGCFAFAYFDHRFPIRPSDYAEILQAAPAHNDAIAELAASARKASPGPASTRLKATLARVAAGPVLPAAAAALSRDRAKLRHLLDRQAYRLAPWREASARINYRRFFDINQLAGIRAERPEVFQACHRRIGELIADGSIHGLRIDHVDGLADPADYCRRLRKLVDRRRPDRQVPFVILVEKILAEGEPLRADWGVDGTTGYEAVNLINKVFVERNGADPLATVYAEFTGSAMDFDKLLHAAKCTVIDSLFGGELNGLALQLAGVAEGASLAYDTAMLRPILREVAAAFPVYRTYVNPRGGTADDRRIIATAVAEARRRSPAPPSVFAFVRRALSGEAIAGTRKSHRRDVLRFAMRFQQFTAPVMAKSLEDTVFYRYARLLSLNEVGGDPRSFGMKIPEFHKQVATRRRLWPHAMLATATHDTKRGEDVRTRLDVLSEIPDLWARHVARWTTVNAAAQGEAAPSKNDEYLIYQTLLGAWPQDLNPGPNADPDRIAAFARRLKAYLLKAVREAKQHSSWLEPNTKYEDACGKFIDRLLDPKRPFLADFATVQSLVARLGALSSLSQTVLKLTLPGVPDTYQGSELWDLSLVDPDNRHAVDFSPRREALDAVSANDDRHALADLRAGWHDGRIKLHLINTILAVRRRLPGLFADGSYEPLASTGPRADNVVAFARRTRSEIMIVAVGRFFSRLAARPDELAPPIEAWADTSLRLPRLPVPRFTDVLSTRTLAAAPGRGLAAADLFQELPAAVLIAEVKA